MVLLLGAALCKLSLASTDHTAALNKELTEWLLSNGGETEVELARVPGSGIRGLVALRDLAAGEHALSMPQHLHVNIGYKKWSDAENAVSWLQQVHMNSSFQASHGPWLRSLPQVGDLLGRDLLTPHMTELLDSEAMAHDVDNGQAWSKLIWNGEGGAFAPQPVWEIFEGHNVSLIDFLHAIVLVSSRAFQLSSPEGLQRVFFPWIDMANNGINPNTMLTGSDDFTHLHTLRAVAKGEEITWTYHYALNRMDYSFMDYSFLPEENGLLAAVDLPHFVLGVTEVPEDDANYGPDTSLSQEELVDHLQHLEDSLDSMRTTLEEDAVVLAEMRRSQPDAWQEPLVIEFGMRRKRALRSTLLTGYKTALLLCSPPLATEPSEEDTHAAHAEL